MIDFERKVLAEIADPGSQEGLIQGAAMNAAIGFLQGAGFLTRGAAPAITQKGRDALGEDE